MKPGYLVYTTIGQNIVARYVGGNQTTEEILSANNYDDTHDCVKFGLPEEHGLNDYIVVNNLPELAPGADQNILDRQALSEFKRKVIRLLLEINLDQENRIRVLEGIPIITAGQYRTQLINQYKAL